MARKKDIESLFRESEHKLTERPSLQAWRRLEHKLEHRRQRHRIGYRRMILVAAAVVTLVAVTGLFSPFLNQNESPSSITDSLPYFETEDLVNTKPQPEFREEVNEYLRKVSSRKTDPAILEGTKDKVLLTARKNRDI
ncbi:MAG: hypothetical protein D6714_13135 [Bacteroidetes bacterium]|nr:MAG: hypothetical protein D6714_13135 [Bacteroidota bacterium]